MREKKRIFFSCCSLNTKCPHRLVYLKAWSPAVGTVRGGSGTFGGALLEELHHWGLTLRLLCFSPIPVLSLPFLCVD